MFKVLRNGLLRYRLYTCPNLWCNSCSKCYAMDCFGTYFTHVQTCDVTRVQSATQYDCFGAYFTHCFGVRLSVFVFRLPASGFRFSSPGSPTPYVSPAHVSVFHPSTSVSDVHPLRTWNLQVHWAKMRQKPAAAKKKCRAARCLCSVSNGQCLDSRWLRIISS